MKIKTLIIVITLIISSSAAFANWFVDTDLSYGKSWSDRGGSAPDSRETLVGINLGGGIYIHNQFNLKLNLAYYRAEPDYPTEIEDAEEDIFNGTLGIEFIAHIPFLARYRVYWMNNLSFGVTWVNVKVDNQYMQMEDDDYGYLISFNTGFYFQYSQLIAPYFTIGYGKILFQGDWSADENHMLIFRAGVRFFFFDSRNIDEEF